MHDTSSALGVNTFLTPYPLPFLPPSLTLQSEFPCFEYMGDAALTGFKKKLMLGATESDVTRRARRMVENANGSWGTCFYDKFQLWTNGIMP